MKLRSRKSVCGNIQENGSMKQEESIIFVDDQTDVSSESSDEFDIPQTSRKRKKNSSSCNNKGNRSKKPKSSKLGETVDKSSDGIGTSRDSSNHVGLVKKKNGNFGVKIYDRIRKKDVWLGTFGLAEEASKVYWAKKEELEKEFEVLAKNIVVVEQTRRTSEFVGVSRRASGKFAAHIRDPIRKKKLYLGAFDSEKEASKAYLAKKEELMKEVKEDKTGARWYLGRRDFRKPESLIIRKRRGFGGDLRKRREFGGDLRKRREFGGELRKSRKVCEEIEWVEDDPYSDDQESSMEMYESESSEEGIPEEENDDEDPSSEDDQLSWRSDSLDGANATNKAETFKSPIIKEENDDEDPSSEDDQLSWRSDSLDGANATNKAETFKSPIIKEENGEPCLDNQECSREQINPVGTSHQKEAVPMDPIVPEHDIPIQNICPKDELIAVDSSFQSVVDPETCSNANVLARTNSGTPLVDSNGCLLGEWSWIDNYGLSMSYK